MCFVLYKYREGWNVFQGRRCINTSFKLRETLQKVDKDFEVRLCRFLPVKNLYICYTCTNKMNKIETRLSQMENSREQLECDKRALKKGMSEFRYHYLNFPVTPTKRTTPMPISERRPLTPVVSVPTSQFGSSVASGEQPKTPRRSSKIPRRHGFSPFSTKSSGQVDPVMGSSPSSSKIPIRRKTPTGMDDRQSKENIQQAFSAHPAKKLFQGAVNVLPQITQTAALMRSRITLDEEELPLEEDLAIRLETSQHIPVAPAPKPKSSKDIHSIAKITVKYGETEKTRYLAKSDVESVAVCRGLVQGGKQGAKQVANAVFSISEMRDLLTEKILGQLNSQCAGLCSTARPTLLRDTSPQHFNKLDLERVLEEWIQRDLVYKVLARIMNIQYQIPNPTQLDRRDILSLISAGSCLLFRRCQQVSALQHAIGLLLDFGGAKNKTITALSNCGLTVSTVSVFNKRKAIEKYHDATIEDMLLNQRREAIDVAISSIPCLPMPLYAIDSSNIEIIRHMLNLGCFTSEPVRRPTFVNWDIYGDNLDHSIKPFQQTMEKRTQDIHWFLLVGAPLRVVPPASLNRTHPRLDIKEVPNCEFLPATRDHDSLRNNFVFHVLEVLTQYVTFLKTFRDTVPKHIAHKHVREMPKRSSYILLDVLDKSENKNDDMIDILDHIHEQYVPGALGENIVERMVFGGDQLTNERAYSAQQNMPNATNSSSGLMGLLHRTEGLHLCMNTCLYILETYYSSTSVRDCGTLYQLKTLVDRRNLKFDMTTGYNQAKTSLMMSWTHILLHVP